MSACISRHGEYSAHTLGHANTPDEFVCSWCGAFDEDAARSEVGRLRGILAAIAVWRDWYVDGGYPSFAEWRDLDRRIGGDR